MEKQCTNMELEYANLKGAHMTLQKMGKQNASWKEAKIANGGRIERVNATWKGAHLTNEHMQGTNASWKEATWYVENIHRWNGTREKGKCQMQHTWKQQINLDKVVKTCAEDKGNIKLEKGGPRWTREAEEERAMLRLMPAKWTGGRPKGKLPDPNWGPPKLDTFWRKSQKTDVKSKKKNKNQRKTIAKKKKAKQMGPR